MLNQSNLLTVSCLKIMISLLSASINKNIQTMREILLSFRWIKNLQKNMQRNFKLRVEKTFNFVIIKFRSKFLKKYGNWYLRKSKISLNLTKNVLEFIIGHKVWLNPAVKFRVNNKFLINLIMNSTNNSRMTKERRICTLQVIIWTTNLV